MGRFVFRRQVLSEIPQMAGVKASVLAAAKEAEVEAKRLAPVETGRYRDSIRAEVTAGGARVASDVEYAAAIEFGTVDTPVFAPLRKGAEAAGFSLRGR